MGCYPTIFLVHLRKTIFLATLCVISCLVTATVARAASQEAAAPLVKVYESGESSLNEILRGESGEAYLVYYLPEEGPERPALVVRLLKVDNADDSTAEVYDTPPDEGHVPVEYIDGYPTLPDRLLPTVTITALGGWWEKDEIVNFNLDINVNGPIMTMWASGGDTGWAQFIAYGEANAKILIRDRDGDGVADWDWRTMLPEFPNRGDYRTTYAERKCDSPLQFEGGPFPAWPFIAGNAGFGFEQLTGVFRPPIVVDWEDGRIWTFSEIVTLRNQNCGYGMHSITRVLPSQMNSPNFEIPFAFYDLSGIGIGYPNLILRTGRTILEYDTNGLAAEQMQVIRYSWSNKDAGDGSMDYKVEVFGFHPYDFETPIADGQAFIDAPPYELFPEWVISKSWPVVTFNDAEERNYLTSEGIYEWAPGDLGEDFYLGYTEQGNIDIFADITTGMRGEYRIGTDRPSDLYMSPIDNRLHLKWAEHGIWRLDDEQIIRLANPDGDEYIDAWSRELMKVTAGAVGEPLDGTTETDDTEGNPPETVVIETLYALEGYLLHAGDGRVTLAAADYEPSLFETLPPTDHDTWEAHRAQLAPYEAQRRDPADLRSWLDAFPGPRGEIAGATVANVRSTADGFRFELALEPDFRATGQLNLVGLAPGDYLVEQRGEQFLVSPLIPAQVTIDVRPPDAVAPARVIVGNTGAADAPGLTLVVEAEWDGFPFELLRRPVDALAGETAEALVTIPSNLPAGSRLTARLEDAAGAVVAAGRPLALPGMPPPGRAAIFSLDRVPVLMPVLALFAAALGLAVLLAARREETQ